ncbi:MAG TPA: folylpolyglutamate synthase/dihydrofolate synthase family protein [Myxococcota bacterium]|nr:folylpolyglutamate synthase/dihydrofolate synthase family protein [Myxococcota bacterium]
MRIEQVTAFLYSLKPKGIRFGLENTRLVLDKLARPQDAFEAVHIAGSNGKGSTAAFAESMLSSGGVRAGLYTSPHLDHYRERFRVAGRTVADTVIEQAMDVMLADGLDLDPAEVSAWIDERGLTTKMDSRNWYHNRGEASRFCRLTFFECTTILAALIFARLHVEVAVMECGMGGRLDATNVFSPVVAAIAPVCLEHTEWLGDTLAAVAAEKAGIIKRDVPVVCARQEPLAMEVIAAKACEIGAPLFVMGDSFDAEGEWSQAVFRLGQERLGPVRLGLVGRHQVDNAALALACLRYSSPVLFPGREAACEGLRKARWPARFEILGAEGEWILDGAHNPAGVHVLVTTVTDIFPDHKMRVVFGVLGDKDVEPMLREIETVAESIELVMPPDARGRDPAGLASLVHRPHAVHESVGAALSKLARQKGPPVLVTGSLTVAGEARRWLLDRNGIDAL